MNQNPSDDSPNAPESGRAVVAGKAAPNQNDRSDRFNPLLQHALNSLDIKLEDELNRFRSKQADPTLDVAVASPVEVVWEQQAADFDDADILTAEIVRSAIAYPDREPQSSQGFIAIDGLSTATERQGSDRHYASTISLHPDRSTDRDNLDLNFSAGGEIAPMHDEYSSSSQELLRQIQSGYTTDRPVGNADAFAQRTATPKTKRKLSPLKIGSMAAACVIAGGAAYTYFNPSILAPLATTKTTAPTVATTTSSLGQAIQSPNLAANEFTDLSLSAVNTIKIPTATAPANISNAPTATFAPPASAATAPAAVPFKSGAPILSPTATITAQPRLADSLVRSLLPPNFQAVNERSLVRPMQPQLKR